MPQKTLSPQAKIKNLLRVFFNTKKRIDRWKQFQELRLSTPQENLDLLWTIVEENKNYPFSGLGSTFPKDKRTFLDPSLRLLSTISLEREADILTGRINYHKSKIIESLFGLVSINNELSNRDWQSASDLIQVHKYLYGLSIICIKKELLATIEQIGFIGLGNFYRSTTEGIRSSAYAYITKFYYDFSDPTFNPARSVQYWANLTSTRMAGGSWYSRITEHQIFLSSTSKDNTADTLLRYGSVSLIDATLCIWEMLNTSHESAELKYVWQRLDDEIKIVLEQNFSFISLGITDAFTLAPNIIRDTEIYRQGCSTLARWLGIRGCGQG